MDTEFLNSLSKDFVKLLCNSEDYNVIIKVGESPNIENFKAHSCVLRARSPYFYSALSGNWAKTEGNAIIFEKSNISSQTFQMVLEYLYSGTISLDQSHPTHLLDLLVAADELILTELVKYLKDFLLNSHHKWICQHPLQVLYHTAFRLESCKELQELCLKIICENPTLIFGTTAFLTIDEPVLVSILQRDDLQIDEVEIWDFLIRWGIAHTRTPGLDADVSKWSNDDFSALKSTLQNCIPLVKFSHISPDEIPSRLSPFNRILTSSDKCLREEDSMFKTLIDSKIIKLKHASLISHWIDLEEDKKRVYRESPSHEFKLLLRGSRDGFSARKFHELCDHKGRTIVVMKVAGTGKIVGGYNPVSWRSGFFGRWIKTNDSFIFSFDDNENLNNSKICRILSQHSGMALFGADVRGPCFGNRDLWMSNFNNLSRQCSSQRSYYDKSVIDSNKFDVEDYEVFLISKNNIPKEEKIFSS
ncbi:14305_t:CDS:2 [Acaulospora colombiana]|uniref:14305_t:CDS:1 n=1 Tax=Acaulospora colombiana TaxID=27376 RepID=A0ACA9KNF7_9GLOM|nr:14305_t:CDS:2 [Acaulospora colombiana]